MTIETRMSYPEGGSECPPEESPVPGSPSSMAISSGERLGAASIGEEDALSPSSSSSNQSNKVTVVPSQQRSKFRNVKNLPLMEDKPNDQSSDEIANMNNNSTDKNDCTKCTVSLAGAVKAEDLKKPTKVKTSPSEAGEGSSKEEAASRKSMRLRLKRRNAADDPFVSKKLPRYVEDLTNVDFADEKQKVQFMHVLGMSFTPNKAKMESRLSPDSVVPLGPEKASEEKVPGPSINPVLEKCDKGAKAQLKTTKVIRMRGPERTEEPLSAVELNNQAKSNPSDDNSGWENWVTKLLTEGKGKSETRSPTPQEINDSLERLRALGTSVKIVK